MTASQPVTTRAYCTLCRSRCGAVYTVAGGQLVGVAPDPHHPTGGALCAKGRALPELLHHPERLRSPLRRTNPKGSADPGWQEITYDEALDEIAARMVQIREAHGPEAVAFAVTTPSGSPISDSIDWILRLIWQFGSPNLIAAVEVCNFQKDYGQALTFGQPLGVPDYERADVIVLWGHNPARTWLAQAQRIAEARRRGAKVVVIDPRRAGSGEQADLWLRVRPGSDAALAMGAIRYLLETRRFAADFVRDWTDAAFLIDLESDSKLPAQDIGGASGYVVRRADGQLLSVDPAQDWGVPADVDLFFTGDVTDRHGRSRPVATALAQLWSNCAPWDPARVTEATGIPAEQLLAFYELIAAAGRVAYYHWTGTAQALNATQTTRAMSALFALRDDVDVAGGNRWLAGLPAGRIADPALLSAGQRAKALGLAELPLGPPAHGFITLRDFCESVASDAPNRARALIGFGANLLMSQPDAARTTQALESLEFQVHCDLFMTPTAQSADIILPVTASLEHDALRLGFEISERAVSHVQFRSALVPPPGAARPDYAIARGLARRLGLTGDLWRGAFTEALDPILAPLNLSVEHLRAAPEGIEVPVKQVERRYAQPGAQGGPTGFATASRRIEFHSARLRQHGQPAIPVAMMPPPPDPRFPIRLSTAKSGYYTHSSLRNLTSLRRRAPDPTVEISPALARRCGVVDRDWALVGTDRGEVRLRVRIDPELADDVAIAEFGWWQACDAVSGPALPVTGAGSANINAVIGDQARDPVSGAPGLRALSCTIRRDEALSQGNWQGERVFELVAREVLAGDVLRMVLAPADGRPVPRFLPGQHLGLSVPGVSGRRFYSLISTGAQADHLEIAVRRNAAPAGAVSLSNHLHDFAQTGDLLMITPPTGSFIIPVNSQRPVICIAGGIGITPFVSAFRACADVRDGAGLTLHAITRRRDTAVFHETLSQLASGSDRLNYTLHVRHGDVPDAPHVRAGGTIAQISAAIEQTTLDRRPLIYLCGPESLMSEMRLALVARGVPASDIIAEAFKTDLALPKDLRPARITLARSGRSFVWTPAAGSLLSAALTAGIALPSGCQVGQCESCAVKVLSGQFHASGTELPPDQCLTCQSVPLGDLTLDY